MHKKLNAMTAFISALPTDPRNNPTQIRDSNRFLPELFNLRAKLFYLAASENDRQPLYPKTNTNKSIFLY